MSGITTVAEEWAFATSRNDHPNCCLIQFLRRAAWRDHVGKLAHDLRGRQTGGPQLLDVAIRFDRYH
jgi:hypothetical protein